MLDDLHDPNSNLQTHRNKVKSLSRLELLIIPSFNGLSDCFYVLLNLEKCCHCWNFEKFLDTSHLSKTPVHH